MSWNPVKLSRIPFSSTVRDVLPNTQSLSCTTVWVVLHSCRAVPTSFFRYSQSCPEQESELTCTPVVLSCVPVSCSVGNLRTYFRSLVSRNAFLYPSIQFSTAHLFLGFLLPCLSPIFLILLDDLFSSINMLFYFTKNIFTTRHPSGQH
jgi:hypothetical protein